MKYSVDIQKACVARLPLARNILRKIAIEVLQTQYLTAEITLRFVELAEITQLNYKYRHINASTNVLSFAANLPKEIQQHCCFLGDVIICTDVLKTECIALNKSLRDHAAHIVVHGILHLLGFDHIKTRDALNMQAIEIKLLTQLGFAHPYFIVNKDKHDTNTHAQKLV